MELQSYVPDSSPAYKNNDHCLVHSWSRLRFFSILPLLHGVRAFEFDQPPATITAFQPRTLRWFRNGDDGSGTQEIEFIYQASGLTEDFGLTTVDDTQSEGLVTFTFTTVGPLGRKFHDTGILVVLPTTGSEPPSISGLSPSMTSLPDTSINNNNFRAKIIGGTLGSVGFVVILTMFLLFRRRRGRQVHNSDDETIPRPLSLPPPILDPYPIGKEPTSMPSPSRKGGERSDAQDERTAGHQFIDS
ncbi:hypothetical protein PM082_014877 [Marasmius tenuissimus]|nr:hypothetical protein PM082_014877 [Marasmius tenuissimus]